MGENSVLGDVRWAGAWGIQADFIAKTPCSIMCVDKNEVLVRSRILKSEGASDLHIYDLVLPLLRDHGITLDIYLRARGDS